jgi:hypothetical protein
MFSKPYEGVAYFGLWAEESADDWGASDALGLLRDAVLRCVEEDMRKDEIWAALDYLSARTTRKASFRSLRKAMDVENPVERYNAARAAYHTIGQAIGAGK